MADAISTRDAYGQALLEVGERHPEMVVLDADLAGSTRTEKFGQRWPERFFDLLRQSGIEVRSHPFPDHHRFRAREIAPPDDLPVLMTEKDAVKCQRIAGPRHWFVPVTVEPEPRFLRDLAELLEVRSNGQETARHPGVPGL